MPQGLTDSGVILSMTPERNPGLTRNWGGDALWAIVANLSQAAGPFLGLIAISQLHGLQAAGRFAYAQALTAPLILLFSFQLKALLLTHGIEEFPTSRAAGMRALSTVIGIASVFALLLVATPLAALLMAARLVDSWAELFQADHQRNQKMWRSGVSNAVRAVLFLAAILAAATSEEAIAAYIVLSLLVLAFFDIDSFPPAVHWDFAVLQPFLKRGAVLGVVLFLQSSQSSIPRLVLGHFGDEASLGLFATLSVLLQAGNLVASGFGQGLLPALGEAPLERILKWAALPAVAAVVVLALVWSIGEAPLGLLHLPPYQATYPTLLALCFAQLAVWPGAMISYALTARRLYRRQVLLTLLMNAVSIAASFAFIPRFGAVGAAISLGCTALTLLVSAIYLLTLSPPRSSGVRQ